MPPTKAPFVPSREEESQELTQFREEWKAEVVKKMTTEQAFVQPDTVASGSKLVADIDNASLTPSINHVPSPEVEPATSTSTGSGASEIPQPSTHIARSVPLLGSGSAFAVYRQAAEHGSRRRNENDVAGSFVASASQSKSIVDGPVNESTPVRVLKLSVTGTLAGITEGFPSSLTFQPEIEEEPVYLACLPDELILRIVHELEPTSVERFASVCRKSRIITLDYGIWRTFVEAIYKPPQLEDVNSVLERYAFDYRRVFVEQPRIRLDGVYIATCYYVRQGLGDNTWINVSHVITYQRYLRFYPNGQVLSLLVNEDNPPQHVIPLLKPALRMKGFYIGKWRLTGTEVDLSNLSDASGRFPVATDDSHHQSHQSGGICQYSFNMTLNLASRPLGRWNKMTIEAYNSVNLETGDIIPVALKHERSFWFSKVRSYGLY